MANLRTTSDLVDSVLEHSGELTNGTSSYEAAALRYVNNLHRAIVSGGNEFKLDLNEPWAWAVAKRPIILELQPPYETGTVTLTEGSMSGVFSSAPSFSVEGWHLKIEGREDYIRIEQHDSSSVNFEMDSTYSSASGTLNFKAIKFEYDLYQDHFVVTSRNNKLDFSEVTGVELTATLSGGVYTATELSTEIKTQLEAVGVNTYTVSFDSISRRFTLSSDGGIFELLFATGSNKLVSIAEELGFDPLNLDGSLEYTSINIVNSIDRLISPMRQYRARDTYGNSYKDRLIYEVSYDTLIRDYQNRSYTKVPEVYCVLQENYDGSLRVIFSNYVEEKTRVEVPYIPVPRDLHDNAASFPLVPRAFREAIVFGAAYYILLDKADNKAQTYEQKAAQKLQALINDQNKQRQKAGRNYGQIVPRVDGTKTYRDFD